MPFWKKQRGTPAAPAMINSAARRHAPPAGPAMIVSGVAAALTFAAGGCSSYEAPNLKVIDARVTERSEEGVVLTFTIDAENPNEEGLPLRDVDYRVSLNGRQVFEGTRSAEATLRRYGTQQIRLPAVVAIGDPALAGNFDAGGSIYRIEGTLRYVTPGEIAEILFDAGVRRPSVGFSGEGTTVSTTAPTAPGPGGAPAQPPAQPVQQPAGSQPPAEPTPADQAPADQAPAQQAPSEQAPAEDPAPAPPRGS